MATWKRLVRFVSENQIHHGDLISSVNGKYTVRRLDGNPFDKLIPTAEVVTTEKLLCPITETPIVICIGLNYQQHAKEANLTIPKYPPVFTKPADALAGPSDAIFIHPDARSMLDYEGELTVIIGRDAKNVTEESALDYVLGYTAGNDLSARNFQLPEASGGQFCYAKSFDAFAPIGHAIFAAKEVPDPQNLRLTTKVNGFLKQETQTADMIFGVRQIIAHLSRGTTIRQGTVIMTGTPAGVGYFRKEFLSHGDVVEVGIDNVATTRNEIRHYAD